MSFSTAISLSTTKRVMRYTTEALNILTQAYSPLQPSDEAEMLIVIDIKVISELAYQRSSFNMIRFHTAEGNPDFFFTECLNLHFVVGMKRSYNNKIVF